MENYNPDTQLIDLAGLLNCRDLGGMPLSPGKVFARGKFIRTSSPSYLSAEECASVRAYGVTTVVDLRSSAELARYGNPFCNDGVTDFHAISLFLGDPDDPDDKTMYFLRDHKLGDFYVLVLKHLGPAVVEVLRVLLDSPGIAMFHCAHGKDRTGIIAAILYLLAGASRENIILNYKVSYDYLRPLVDPLIAKCPDILKPTLRSDAVNMEILLDYIDSEYSGDIRKFLLENGMTSSEIEALTLKCLT